MDPKIFKSMQAASGAGGGKGWEILSYTDKIAQTREYNNSSINDTINGLSLIHI